MVHVKVDSMWYKHYAIFMDDMVIATALTQNLN